MKIIFFKVFIDVDTKVASCNVGASAFKISKLS